MFSPYLKFNFPSLFCIVTTLPISSLRFSVCLNQLNAELNKKCVPDPGSRKSTALGSNPSFTIYQAYGPGSYFISINFLGSTTYLLG